MAIDYVDRLEGIEPGHLAGFFVGWPDPPSPEVHLELLRRSAAIELAIATGTEAEAEAGTWTETRAEARRVVGFVTAISDGVLAAYIPLLEVLPAYQGRGIGGELMRRLLARLRDLYMVDLSCDPGLQPFYEKVGMQRCYGMMLRRHARQSGAPAGPSPRQA